MAPLFVSIATSGLGTLSEPEKISSPVSVLTVSANSPTDFTRQLSTNKSVLLLVAKLGFVQAVPASTAKFDRKSLPPR
jgi:hypothetical protein